MSDDKQNNDLQFCQVIAADFTEDFPRFHFDRQDQKEGRGTMTWVERRERYTGEWKADVQCGYGEHVWIEDRYG